MYWGTSLRQLSIVADYCEIGIVQYSVMLTYHEDKLNIHSQFLSLLSSSSPLGKVQLLEVNLCPGYYQSGSFIDLLSFIQSFSSLLNLAKTICPVTVSGSILHCSTAFHLNVPAVSCSLGVSVVNLSSASVLNFSSRYSGFLHCIVFQICTILWYSVSSFTFSQLQDLMRSSVLRIVNFVDYKSYSQVLCYLCFPDLIVCGVTPQTNQIS